MLIYRGMMRQEAHIQSNSLSGHLYVAFPSGINWHKVGCTSQHQSSLTSVNEPTYLTTRELLLQDDESLVAQDVSTAEGTEASEASVSEEDLGFLGVISSPKARDCCPQFHGERSEGNNH